MEGAVLSLASSAGQAGPPPGPFMVAWGLVASAYGVAMITNYRGFADNFLRRARASRARWRSSAETQLRSCMTARQMRLMAAPFAVLGPVMTIAGINSISHEGAGGTWLGTGAGPYRFAFLAAAVAGTGWSWLSRNGLFRPAIRRRGSSLLVALVASAGTVLFGLGLATGQMTICLGGWAIGGLAATAMMLDDKPSDPGSPDGRD
jgi:hypothetical protein